LINSGLALQSPQLRAENHRSGGRREGGAAARLDLLSTRRRVPVRSAILMLALAAALAGCSSSSPTAPQDATESAAMVQKNCNDPHWRDQNLGLWYSVCRPSLRW
jgi:hypothetical protein